MPSDLQGLVIAPVRAPFALARMDRRTVFALALAGVIAIVCAAAPLLAPYNPNAQPGIIYLKSMPPSPAHPFGTDPFSRDVLSRVLYGGRVSLAVALVATLLSVTLGTLYGAIAGMTGGWADGLMMRILDALLSIPRLLLLIAVFAVWRAPLSAFIAIVGATGWYAMARVVRGQVLALKTQDFVLSARALGAGRRQILLRHILPNVLSPIIVAAALGVGHVILLEAGLSYLGVGIQQPDPSWGNIIQDGADQPTRLWWIWFFPGMAILLTVMVFNYLGDRLREASDPRSKRAP
jgi:ABC-type dipeptide/oligopeptide/nickel transport system permease subunit